ncbi:MAG: S9 family peptidase [Gemmatimonadales bacterium]|nr:MAG: S9 family peptidase [Gemmatimonadales bacterium]
MPRSPAPRSTAGLFLALLLGLLPAVAATAQPMESDERRTLAAADFGRFETLGAVSLSPDGAWAGIVVPRVEEDGEVRIHRVAGGEPHVVANGARVEFSPAGDWVAVVVQPSQAERERAGGNRTPPRNALVLHRLGTDEEEQIDGVQAFSFSPDGAHLVMRRYREGGNNQEHRGADLVVREVATGVDVNFGNVAEAAWASEGALLALVTDAAGMAGNGVRLFEAESGRIRTLRSESARFTSATWRDDSTDLALMRVDPDSVRGDTVYSVLAWRDVHRDQASPVILDGAVAGGSHGVVTNRGLRWSTDGSRLFFGVREREPQETSDEDDEADETAEGAEGDAAATDADEAGGDAPRTRVRGEDEAPGLEIWHARDVDPVPQQRVRANQERNRSHLAAWSLAGEPVLLGGGELDESVTLHADEEVVLLSDAAPHAADRMFGPIYQDIYRVDLDTGARTRVAERVEHGRGVSPGGRWYLQFMDDHYWIHDLETGTSRNLTSDVPATFTNEQVDVVVPQKPPYGVAGWTEGDEYVLLYDRYDIWRIRPDGSEAERLTEGAEEELRHRIVRVGDDDPFLASDGPWWVSLYGDFTKQFGYGRLVPGAGVERLILDDRNVGRLIRADDADVYAWVTQRYDEPPALHVGNGDLASATRVMGVNQFVADEFLWGRSELVDYENEWGVPLQGILTYPADFEAGRRYPMVVYHYERLSQGLHNWVNPSQRSAYNVTAFSQAGYFVLRPDIVYRPRNPGLSFMESALPALDAALATGHIDPDRVGILGHSWGGYQTTFAVTQTDRFAAAVAGAPLTNLVSMYLSFYWNTGSTDARIFEISQGRMEVPWWEDFESYRANSPVHHITEMRTPLLMAFGDEDGAVEFNQGVEFYNAARRANRDFVLLVYEGENHSLRQSQNQLDYYRRTHEWFAHYLKGEPAPAWITEGVRFLDQQEKLEEGPAAGRAPLPR